ncbi:MAG TPA: glycosyltransferase 87 family protein [Nocardioidaceae bacterium]|nr:glycosyltransferase 87 family protein [Nocardioidaceae bacterium]
MSRIVRPSREDPFVAAASESIGGPVGDRARPHPWWTPVRVILAVACLAAMLGMVAKSPCVIANWTGNERYATMCYSDTPYLYAARGFAERAFPFGDAGERYQAMEYPVVIAYFAYGTALITHGLSGWPDLEDRAQRPADQVYSAPGVAEESGLYFMVTAVLLGACLLLSAYFLAGGHRGRPWDAMLFAASPALVLTGLVNWDLLAVVMVAGAMWAWARGQPLLSGVFIGLGTATKLYPMFLLGALLIVGLRNRRLRPFTLAAGASVATWVLVNAPAVGYGFDQWKLFWTFNSDRGADLGSLWLVWQQAGHPVGADLINKVSWLFFGGVCVAVLLLGLLARRTPRIPQLALLVVAGFLLVNKVYSPQYVLWLLPLAVLARPRWRDILIWQAGEVFYFAAVWLYLGEFTAPGASGEPDRFYWLAILVRVLCELYLVAVVVRDILSPWHDPVRADGLTEDPMQPEIHRPV